MTHVVLWKLAEVVSLVPLVPRLFGEPLLEIGDRVELASVGVLCGGSWWVGTWCVVLVVGGDWE